MNCITEKLDALFSDYRSGDTPGCIVAVARHGKPIYRAAFGLASLEHGVVNTPATQMPIASVTKHFTCAAVLMLAAEGRLTLDDRVGHWIPDLPVAQRSPTLRQLMTHTSGVRCYLDHAVFNGYETMPVGMPAAIQFRQTEVNFEPGEGSSYSNGGYLLLSWVIEKAAGAPLEEVLHGRLFEPAGMRSTHMPRRQWPAQLGVAAPYLPCAEGSEQRWRQGRALTEESFGDGGMVSTVDDLLRWAQYLRQGEGPVSLDQLAVMTPLAIAERSSNYGFGLITETWRGVRLAHHAGALPGASSTFLLAAEEGLDVVILCNRPAPVIDLSLRIIATIIPERLEIASSAPVTRAFQPMLGHYLAQQTGLLFGFADLGGELGLSLFGGTPFALQSRASSSDRFPFTADVGTGNMSFRAEESHLGRLEKLQYSDGIAWHSARRIGGAPIAPHETVTAGAGTYYSSAAAATLSLDIDAGKLAVVVQGEYGRARYPAESLAPDLLRFWPAEFPGGMLLRMERESGVVARLVVSTSRTRRTVFQRQARVAVGGLLAPVAPRRAPMYASDR